MPGTFNFNPHRHVKIWLSKDPNLFLPIPNQMVLVKMRELNKNDEISFFYSKNLLNDKAIGELKTFCAKHNIKPYAIEDEVFPFTKKEDKVDTALLNFCILEIKYRMKGGNLAAASDILRFFKKVYEKGTYADFDIEINTSSCPSNVVVQSPVLFPIGSIEKYLKDSDPNSNAECIFLNNDIIAIIDSPEAVEIIDQIKLEMLNAYYDPAALNDNEYYINDIIESMPPETDKEAEKRLIFIPNGGYNKAFSELALQYLNEKEDYHALRFRVDMINTLQQGAETFCKLLHGLYFHDKEYDYDKMKHWVVNFFQQQGRKVDEEASIDDIVQDAHILFYETLIFNSVAKVTGPHKILLTLFSHYIVPRDTVTNKIAPFSFDNYDEIKNVFKSIVIPELHAREFRGGKTDYSWQDSGMEDMNALAKKMNDSAYTIARFFKKHTKSIQEEPISKKLEK